MPTFLNKKHVLSFIKKLNKRFLRVISTDNIKRKITQDITVEIITISIIILIGIILIPYEKVPIWKDAALYLDKASKIYNNPSPETIITWRPILPIILSITFFLKGKATVIGAFITTRLFYVLSLLMCYLIGKKFFNRKTGLVFISLILTSFWIGIFSSYVNLDIVIVGFILSSIYFLKVSFDSKRKIYFIISGITMGLGFLSKPTLFFPIVFLPIILMRFHDGIKLKKFFLIYIFFLLILSPWIIKTFLLNISLELFLGDRSDNKYEKLIWALPNQNQSSNIILKLISMTGYYLKEFINNYLFKYFIISPLLVISSLTTLLLLIKKRASKNLKIVVYIFALFIPFTILITIMGFRPSQLLITYLFLYLITSNFLVNTLNQFVKKFPIKIIREKAQFFTFIVIITVSLIQIFMPFGQQGKDNFLNMFRKEKNSGYKTFTLWREKPKVSGRNYLNARLISNWLRKKSKPGEIILTNVSSMRRSLILINQGEYKFHTLKTVQIQESENENYSKENNFSPYVFFTNKGKEISDNSISIIYLKNLEEKIQSSKIRYIILTSDYCFLSTLLKSTYNYKTVYSHSNFEILKTNQNRKTGKRNDVFFEDEVIQFLINLKEKKPSKYLETKKMIKYNLKHLNTNPENFFEAIEDDDTSITEDQFTVLNCHAFKSL